jgi:Obg family GTPase CgtA-like protein
MLIDRGIINDLRERGVKEGDLVSISDIEFEFID